MARPKTPLLWFLFSMGGTVAAFLIPVHLFLFGIAFPLGWIQGPSHAALLGLVRHPLVRLYLFVLISLPLFHWAHRFRYTLYDGLKLKHLTELIAARQPRRIRYGASRSVVFRSVPHPLPSPAKGRGERNQLWSAFLSPSPEGPLSGFCSPSPLRGRGVGVRGGVQARMP